MNTLNENESNDSELQRVLKAYKAASTDNDYYYFYKYLSFDTSLFILDIFKNCNIKFTSPKYFNDPYDCLYNLDLDFSDFNHETCNEAYGSISEERWLTIKDSFKNEIQTTLKQKFIDSTREQFIVTCFTTDPINILMWSHYAENHTGFVIEFKFLKGIEPKFEGLEIPLPVIYTDDFPTINFNWNIHKSVNNPINIGEIAAKMSLTKASCWSYENEFRSVLPISGHEGESLILIPFKPTCISSIILGPRVRQDHKTKMGNVIEQFNVQHQQDIAVYQSEIDSLKFKLNVPNHPRIK